MMLLILSGVLVIVIGGCLCVVWAARGGPRWVRAAATATLTAGELLRLQRKQERRAVKRSGDSD